MIHSKIKNWPKYKKIGCGKIHYHSAQWINGKIACEKCGIELKGSKKSKKYSWIVESDC